MATVIEEVRLICADIGANSNKFWNGWLYDDGHIETEYGRIGVTSTRETIRQTGKRQFDAKVAAKKKGKADKTTGARVSVYTEARTVQNGATQVKAVGNSDLRAIVRQQILTTRPELQKLIDRLIKHNIHKITSTTQIQYNAATGLFTTPLGVVTPDGINDARDYLVAIKNYFTKQHSPEFIDAINKYLRIVPQSVGMKLKVEQLFPDEASIAKQGDLLDAMESSYQATNTAPAANKKIEKVFDVKLDILNDARERKRIQDKYYNTRKGMHASSHLKVKEIYEVEIASTKSEFDKYGVKVGTIKELWHGTSKANLLSILKGGLHVSPPSTARIAGKMFGNGIYFASDSTKSLNYAYGYWSGTRDNEAFMFLADVAMGKYYVPKGSYERLPRQGFDSTWAQGNKSGVINDEFIIYSANQHNLKYLVEFGT